MVRGFLTEVLKVDEDRLVVFGVALVRVLVQNTLCVKTKLLQTPDVIKVSRQIECLGQCDGSTYSSVTHEGDMVRTDTVSANELTNERIITGTYIADHDPFIVAGCLHRGKVPACLFQELKLYAVVFDLLVVHTLHLLNNGIGRG